MLTLLISPIVKALLDEITSAVDEETEDRLYAAISRSIPSYISIGHRSSIRKYHTHELQLRKDGSFAFIVLT